MPVRRAGDACPHLRMYAPMYGRQRNGYGFSPRTYNRVGVGGEERNRRVFMSKWNDFKHRTRGIGMRAPASRVTAKATPPISSAAPQRDRLGYTNWPQVQFVEDGRDVESPVPRRLKPRREDLGAEIV